MVMWWHFPGAMSEPRLPELLRSIEAAHFSYLEMEDSPDKLMFKRKLDSYITEYLSIVPHNYKFSIPETAKVFQRTLEEMGDFSPCNARLGWAALAKYADNLSAQPWRKEYRAIKLYCGYYKHEVEANLVGADTILQAMGYTVTGHRTLELRQPVCPDTLIAISRDALVAHVECEIMSEIRAAVWSFGVRVTWAEVARERARNVGDAQSAATRLSLPDSAQISGMRANTRSYVDEPEVYANVTAECRQDYPRHTCHLPESYEEPIVPLIHPQYIIPSMPYIQDGCVPMYGAVPCYLTPIQAPYMVQSPVYPTIKQANNIPVNGYSVPTGQLIEFETPYENGYREHREERRKKDRKEKLCLSDVSLPRSDTQPSLSKSKEGSGTFEDWDYVYRNLSSKNENEKRFSPSRDMRTLDRYNRDERRSRYQPTTLDLEDGLQALSMDRSYDDDQFRTRKVNENLMKRQESEQKKLKLAKKRVEERRVKREPVGNPPADALIHTKIAQDKVKLLTKTEIKDRKDIMKVQSSSSSSSLETRKKKPLDERKMKSFVENGDSRHVRANSNGSHNSSHSYDSKINLIVTFDETDSRKTPTKINESEASISSRNGINGHSETTNGKWCCTTCTYINKSSLSACEICAKSRNVGSESVPLTPGGRECPDCTLVNSRNAVTCEACRKSLKHCPTYI